MKTIFKRASKSTLAVVLAVCLLFSCMTVGVIATDAAKIADSEPVGATNYLILSYNSNNITTGTTYVTSTSNTFTITASDFGQSSFETGKNYYVGYSSSSSYTGIYTGSTSAGIGTKDLGISGLFNQDYSGYKFVGFSLSSTSIQSVTVTVSGNEPYTYSMTSSTSGGGGDDPEPSGDTTTDTVNQTSGKTIIISYDRGAATPRDYAHAWQKNSSGTQSDIFNNSAMTNALTTLTQTTANELKYVDLTSNLHSGSTYAVGWLAKCGSDWNSNKSADQSVSPGSQGYLYRYNSSDSSGSYDPLKLVSVEYPSEICKNQAAEFTVAVDKGAPYFLNTRGTTTSKYKLSVGTSSGGTNVVNGDTCNYATKSFTFNWTPSASGSQTLYYTLTDGIDTVTYSKAYTVIVPETTHAVTISASPAAGGTVSPSTGTEVGESTSTTITATPNDGYEFSSWTFGTGIIGASTSTNPTTITTESSGDYTVTANFTAKPTHTITVNTNNPAYGTASASVASAYQGQEVTLTATESTGTFTGWTVNSGSVIVSGNTKSATFTMGSSDVSITANFNEYTAVSPFYYNSYGSNGQPAATHYGAQMTEAKLNGETYSYYHVTGRTESEQLFTVSYGSPKYNSYYTYFEIFSGWEAGKGIKVQFYTTDGNNLGDYVDMTYDTEANGKKKFKYPIPDGAREIQFKHGDYTTGKLSLYSGNNAWYTNNSDGSFSDVTGYASSNPVPTNFYENFNGTNKYTDAFTTGGFYSHYASRGQSHAYTKPKGLDSSTKGDYYIVVLYKNKTYTINGVTKTISNDPEIIWMPTLPSAVEDTTETVDIYAKNGTLRDSTFNRFTNLADTDFDTTYFEYTESLDSGVVTYNSIADYNAAHSKTITYDNAVSGYNSDYAIMKNVPIGAKIKIKTTLKATVESNDGSFNNTAFKDTHYLKAYSFNGMSYQVNTPNVEGVYEEIWTVRDVNTKSVSGSTVTNLTKDGKTIEVTPIYYMKDNTNCKTFYIDGYDGTVQNAWGNMLCVYPYYENKSNSANAFGGYPGQPMLFWGGKYQMEIPLTVDGTASGASVKGLTLHNSYWDLLHRSLDIRCNDRNHAQTYDYDDFYKLYKEKNPDTIIFDFKYRTQEDHYSDGYDYTNYTFAGSDAKGASDFTGSSKNGVELVTDYFGRQVDAFGTLIADANKSDYNTSGTQDKELLFVSTGYKDTYVGEYATLWAVYAPQSDIPNTTTKAAEGETDLQDTAGKFIGYISSSMLYLNNWDRRLQYTGGDDSSNGRMSWSEFEKTYNWLKKYYTGVPALISYEKEIWNDSKDKAYRSDGKWYYSNKGDQIEANIIIQYNADVATSADIVASKDKALSDTSKWTTDAFSNVAGVGGQNNIGSTTECAAYFTNTSPNLLGKVNSGTQFADSTKSFTFRADAGGTYMFVNWVRLSNGKYYEISEKELAESVMSSNDTYIARFVLSSSGSLKVSHVVEQTSTYKGTGTPTVTVTVSNGGAQVFTDTSHDGTPIDISSYVQTKYSAYTVNISLSTTPDEDCTLNDISTTAAQRYQPGNISNNATTVQQFTIDDIINDNVSTLRYVSHLTKTVFRYNYEITYTYYSRFWGEQSYTQTGECEDGDFTGSKTGATLTTDFIIGKTPYEKSFRQQINWNYTNSAVASAGGTNDHGAAAMVNNAATAVAGQDNTYKMTAHVYASNTINDKVTAEFVLPYKYNAKDQGYTAKDTDVYTGNEITGKTYLYDTGNESVSLSAKAYNLFTYDDLPHTGSDDTLASGLPLMEAAPYVWMNVNYHTKPANTKRYYTGNSFKVSNITYYLREKPDKSAAGTNEVIITDADVREGRYTVTFIKRGKTEPTTYRYAVAEGTPGTVGYKVYFFAYNMNASEKMTTNDGTVITEEQFIAGIDPVFNGQYIVYTETEEKDGVIANTGVKKYFTRWDIFNTKGDFVASCYNRRFSYSGYDNYVVRPVYDSNTENSYASSLGTGTTSTITYLDDSRNQWKGTNASGTYASTTGQTDLYAADKLFTDFAITYNYNGQNINKVKNLTQDSVNGANIRVGMVIERLDQLDNVGTSKIASASYYADKYKGDTNWQNLAGRLAGTESGTLTSAVTSGHMCYNSKIGANYAVDGYTLFNSAAPGAVSGQTYVIDNFNRLQWFYTINNSTQTGANTAESETTMKNYAYRAISYMIVTDSTGTKAYLCDAPTYFTIYDTATRVGY